MAWVLIILFGRMSEMVRKRAIKNTIFLSGSQILSRAIAFLYFVFLARTLGVSKFGIYVFVLSFVYSFIPLADFGLERIVLRDISRYPQRDKFYLSRLLPLRLFLSLVAYLFIFIITLFLKQLSYQIYYFLIFGLFLFPYNLIFLFSSFLNAKEKMQYMAFANFSLSVLTAILGLVFVSLGWDLKMIFFAYPLANILLLIFFLLNVSRWGVPLGASIDFSFWQSILSRSWVFAALTVVSVFYLRLSLIMTGLIEGVAATGVYGSAFKFIEAAILIPQSVSLALFPHFSRLFLAESDGNKRLKKSYWRGILILFLISLSIVLLFLSLGKFIITFFYGVQYLSAVPVFKILSLSLPLFFVNSLAANIIHNSEDVKLFLPLLTLNFIVKLLLCLWFISRWSIIGAAWAVVGGELFGLLINNLFVVKILKVR
jgi:O-antigen/teichoic acid export membrane protein